tara:strand:+ start:471 stop:695 length:225 start_codon:yes stop_codon:yes gene_type:complete
MPNEPEGAERTLKIKELRTKGLNGNSIAKEVGVSRQYVYKLFRLWKEQEDSLLDYEVEKQALQFKQFRSKNYAR